MEIWDEKNPPFYYAKQQAQDQTLKARSALKRTLSGSAFQRHSREGQKKSKAQKEKSKRLNHV